MKFTSLAITTIILYSAMESPTSTCLAFTPSSTTTLTSLKQPTTQQWKTLHNPIFPTSSSSKSSSSFVALEASTGTEEELSEVEKLRAAAAKAREEAAKLAKELGKDLPNEEEEKNKMKKAAKRSMSKDEIEQAMTMAGINFEQDDATSQTEKLNSLVESGTLALWKSATGSTITTTTTATATATTTTSLRTFPVSLQFLESRTNGQITVESLGFGGEGDVSMDDFKYATLWVTLGASVTGVAALSFLPENIGATVCYLVALIPILFLAVGSTAPGIIAGAIQSAKGSTDSNEERLDRICRHEAGHFLCGYLCGLPIAGYSSSTEDDGNDDTGIQCVEFHPTQEGPITGREFSSDEIAALSCVALSGSVAEVLGLGDAKGGNNDLLQLDGFFRRSKEFIGAARQQDLTRWGALTSYNMITENRDTYERLVQAFKEQKSVAECIAIVEQR